jgi:hypothetical protein
MIALLLSVFASMLLMSTQITPAFAQYGPRADELLIHVYLNPDAEFTDLQSGVLDITDWSLSKYWIDTFYGDPNIEMLNYDEIGLFEVDINHQRWPTGVTSPRDYDPLTDSYKHWQNETDGLPGVDGEGRDWDTIAMYFRRAIAYCVDKETIVSDVLKGYVHERIP